MIKKTITISLLSLALSNIYATTNYQHCEAKMPVGTTCYLNLSEIYPSQPNVGIYQTVTKNFMEYNDFAKKAIAKQTPIQEYIDKKLKEDLQPVVKAEDNKFYLVDGHHHAYGLYQFYRFNSYGIYPNPDNIKFYVTIEKDFSSYSDPKIFWQNMQESNYFWPYTYNSSKNSYESLNYSNLPDSLINLQDDQYRSIFGLARSQGGFKKPDDSQAYFYQFKWAACALSLGYNLSEQQTMSQKIDYTVSFLSKNSDAMIKKCTGKMFVNMPKPTLK